MPKWRLGVAIVLDPPISIEINGLRRALADPSLDRISPHITLVPPVNVSEACLGQASDLLIQTANSNEEFVLELGSADSFWPDNPVLYLKVGGDLDALYKLRNDVFHFPLERKLTWPFFPHLTIADAIEPNLIAPAIAALANFKTTLVVKKIDLLKEQVGRIWSTVSDFALSEAHISGRGGLEISLSASKVAPLDVQIWKQTNSIGHNNTSSSKYVYKKLVITARVANQVVGVVEAGYKNKSCCIENLIVDQLQRGLGIGSRLLTSLEAELKQRGCSTIQVEVLADSYLEHFYLSKGFQRQALAPKWQDGKDVSRLVRNLVKFKKS